MHNAIRRFGVVGLGLALAWLAGCGYGVTEQRLPETGASLEGTIKYRGEQVHFAEVRVISETAMGIGSVGEDGRYKVENCPIGAVRVAVDSNAAKGDHTSLSMSGRYRGPKGEGKVGGGRLPNFVNIDPKYAEPDTSGLGTTIQAGANTYDIVIPR
jgi:hypothetical protein